MAEIKLPKLNKISTKPRKKKKKILLMSDDLRMHSGVATVSKDIVFETLNEYDWVQIGGAIQHPEKGKIVDMSKGLEEFGIKDGYLRVYPVDGYGNEDILREVIALENPDAILHTPILVFGFGFTTWNLRFVGTFQYSIITFGMIYQIHNTIPTTTRVPIY